MRPKVDSGAVHTDVIHIGRHTDRTNMVVIGGDFYASAVEWGNRLTNQRVC